MSLSAPVLGLTDLVDDLGRRPVGASETAFHGMVWDIRRDTVDLGDAGTVKREYLEHPGAVIVLALRSREDRDELFVIKQYRHPVGYTEWELPAGLLDVAGEPPWQAASRELAEEADLVAAQWHVLNDYFASPGGMTEALRIYLARDLTEVPEAQRHEREGEELAMPSGWVDLDVAHRAALSGRINNVGALVGILSAHGARAASWAPLRPCDAPWPQHPAYRV